MLPVNDMITGQTVAIYPNLVNDYEIHDTRSYCDMQQSTDSDCPRPSYLQV